MTITKEKIKEDIQELAQDNVEDMVSQLLTLMEEQDVVASQIDDLKSDICTAVGFDNETVKLDGLTISSSKNKSWSQDEMIKLAKLKWSLCPFKQVYKPVTGVVNEVLKEGGKDAEKLQRAFTEAYSKPTFKRS